jgi:hypothetical protein
VLTASDGPSQAEQTVKNFAPSPQGGRVTDVALQRGCASTWLRSGATCWSGNGGRGSLAGVVAILLRPFLH